LANPTCQATGQPKHLVSMTCIGLRQLKLKIKFRWHPPKLMAVEIVDNKMKLLKYIQIFNY